MVATMTRIRRLCATATRSWRPLWRAARLAISEAPPGTQAKNAVAASSWIGLASRVSKRAQTAAMTIANSPAATIQGRKRATTNSMSGVKYRPSAVPISSWPPPRNPVGLSTWTPRHLASAIAKSGPIIQGIGVPA